jgi:hypothetical protein
VFKHARRSVADTLATTEDTVDTEDQW